MSIEEAFPGLVCGCGAMNFRRVLVQREGRPPAPTVLAESQECHAAFVAPPVTVRDDAHARLVQDAREAAKAYRKPSRQPRPGDKDYRG